MKNKQPLPLVFDLDGTIVYDGRTIPEPIKNWLKKENTHRQIIFASARPIRDMSSLLTDFPNNLWIGGNGSIVKKEQNIHVENVIPQAEFLEIRRLIENDQLDYLIDDDWNYSYQIKGKTDILEKVDQGKLARKVDLEEIKQPIKILLLNLKEAEKIAQQLSELELSIINHNKENTLDISAKGINKYSTLTKWLPDSAYIAFGNDQNDIQLLKNATKAYIVGNQLKLENQPQIKNISKNEVLQTLKTLSI